MQQESDQEKKLEELLSSMRETAREKQRKPGEPVRAGPGGRKRRGGGTGAGHDAGERELLFSHRPLSSDFSGTSFFTKGEPVCFRPFLGKSSRKP